MPILFVWRRANVRIRRDRANGFQPAGSDYLFFANRPDSEYLLAWGYR
jgi:hypothetical protein